MAYAGLGDVNPSAYLSVGLRAYTAATAGTKAANICNSGDANCADVNSLVNGNFDVATAQGTPLNCGGAGGTCTVKTLYDKSGSLNCGGSACDFTNATAANRPTLVFNATGAGRACMAFNGSQFLTSPAATTINQPFSVASYLERTGNFTSLGNVISSANVVDNFQMGPGGSANTVLCTQRLTALRPPPPIAPFTVCNSYLTIPAEARSTSTAPPHQCPSLLD
jgi:hypothetical protein